jgi:hypothetical protein
MRRYDVKSGGGGAILYRKDRDILALARPLPELFRRQLALVQSYSDLRAERSGEILSQIVPQTAAWSAIAGLQPERHRYTFELLGVGLRFVHHITMRFKCELECRRPVEYAPTIQPMILTPGHSTYPSGHATEAYFVAELLPLLAKPDALDLVQDAESDRRSLRAQLRRLAYRIAENRVVAGLHFPIDSLAGQLLGTALARELAACCVNMAGVKSGRFAPAGDNDEAARRFEPVLDLVLNAAQGLELERDGATATNDVHAPVLKQVWAEASEEWK